MQAYLFSKAGGPSVLKIKEVDEPYIEEADHVKVKVKAIGVNYAEVLSRRGQYSWAPKKPYIPGMEAVGTIEETGASVEGLSVGDLVMAGNQCGSYAEKMIVPSHLVFPAFKEFSLEENAAFMVNFVTAWVALARLAKIQPKEKVLIHAGAGGVGTAAVQIAAAKGAEVIATVGSDEKIELAKSLGASMVINYRKKDFYQEIAAKIGKVDVVLEVVGGEVFKKSVALLKPFGRIVIAGFASISLNLWNPLTYWKTWNDAPKASIMKMAKRSYGVFATHVGYLTGDKEITREVWDELKEFVKQHSLKPAIGKTFSFRELPDAHRHMESRKSTGKIVILMDYDN